MFSVGTNGTFVDQPNGRIYAKRSERTQRVVEEVFESDESIRHYSLQILSSEERRH
jgi:hypothetical protein